MDSLWRKTLALQVRLGSALLARWGLLGSMLIGVGLLMVGLLSWQTSLVGQIRLQAGDVVPYDIIAPVALTYESEVRTEEERNRAAEAVPDQYDTADARVRREQVEMARKLLGQITEFRTNAETSPDQKLKQVMDLPDLGLASDVAYGILQQSDEEWAQVVNETPATVDRAMRDEIRQSTLVAARRRIPALINPELSDAAAQSVTEITKALLRPNSFFNADRTEQLRAEARSNVQPQTVSLERGEMILRAGDITTAEEAEAVAQLASLQSEWDWLTTVRALAFTVTLLAVMAIFLGRVRPSTFRHYQELSMLVMVSVIWLLTAKFMVVSHNWLPYLYPLAALGMLIACLVDLGVAAIFTVAFALIVHFMAGYNPVLVVCATTGGLAGVMVLGRGERLSAFLWAGLAVALCNILSFIAFRAPFAGLSNPQLIQTLFVLALNGGLSASIALIGYFLLGNLFEITTSLQLNELSRPTHPLLRQLLLKAAGTYHHTIVVSNLAERAAAAIGADALLTRVGAYYHDIGKTVRPYFFTENISDGSSPHDKLDPITSAQIIISHVTDGVDLAQKYRLPQRIQDFVREHHGRSLVQYFYTQAQRQSEDAIDEAQFRYPGPNPRSKETAILLLADTCEAAVRAMRPATREDLANLVNRLIDERIANGELNACDLTFKDLQTIRIVFIQVLQGVHHPRIVYPEPVRKHDAVSEPVATVATENGAAPAAARPRGVTPGAEEPSDAPVMTPIDWSA